MNNSTWNTLSTDNGEYEILESFLQMVSPDDDPTAWAMGLQKVYPSAFPRLMFAAQIVSDSRWKEYVLNGGIHWLVAEMVWAAPTDMSADDFFLYAEYMVTREKLLSLNGINEYEKYNNLEQGVYAE